MTKEVFDSIQKIDGVYSVLTSSFTTTRAKITLNDKKYNKETSSPLAFLID